jgi:hypothetical protein
MWELKRSKLEETAQYFERRFFMDRSLIFFSLPKFYATLQNDEILSKSLVLNVELCSLPPELLILEFY